MCRCFENSQILGKFSDFLKILRISEKLEKGEKNWKKVDKKVEKKVEKKVKKKVKKSWKNWEKVGKKLRKSWEKVGKKLEKNWRKKSWKKVGRYVFFGQVMSSHHSDQMSQRSQVSRIAPLGCSLMEVHR